MYADDTYGMGGFLAIRKRLAHFSDFCLAVTYMLNKKADSLDYEVGVCILYLVQCNLHGISLWHDLSAYVHVFTVSRSISLESKSMGNLYTYACAHGTA